MEERCDARDEGTRSATAHGLGSAARRPDGCGNFGGGALHGLAAPSTVNCDPFRAQDLQPHAVTPTVAVFSAVERDVVLCGIGGLPRILLYDLARNQVCMPRAGPAHSRACCSGTRVRNSWCLWPASRSRPRSRSSALQVPSHCGLRRSWPDGVQTDGSVVRMSHPSAAAERSSRRREATATLHSASVHCVAVSVAGVVASAAASQVHLWG